jgi:hypothetical protein
MQKKKHPLNNGKNVSQNIESHGIVFKGSLITARKSRDDSLFKPLSSTRVFEEIYEQVRELVFTKT